MGGEKGEVGGGSARHLDNGGKLLIGQFSGLGVRHLLWDLHSLHGGDEVSKV